MNKKIWYTTSSDNFQNALPIGNGSMGAIVHGTLPEERMTLNLDTFWSGVGRREEKVVPKKELEHVRELIFSRRYYDAQQYIQEHMLGQYNESYIPIGELHYRFTQIEGWNNYKRELNLETGVLTIKFEAKQTKYEIKMFASYPDQALVFQVNSEGPGKINMDISLDSKVQYQTRYLKSGQIQMYGRAPSHIEPNYIECETPIVYDEKHPGMAFACCSQAVIQEGMLYAKEEQLKIRNSSKVALYISMVDGYYGARKAIDSDAKKCLEKCLHHVSILKQKGINAIYEEHILDYQSIFNKMDFGLTRQENTDPTDVRLQKLRNGKDDLGLFTLFFDYNRYLMIASSRRGSQPANLQGIWNESVRPVWSSNWTININTEMNYWPACPCNLTECYEPLLTMLQELSVVGKETAEKQFHCRGWVANHNIDLWRHTEPVGGDAKYAYWPLGGVWLSAQIYDYYAYTLDKKCLQEKIYPIMRGAVQFCLDWMVEGKDGKMHTAPSTSPENTFLDDQGRECGVSYSSTMDLAIIRELFIRFQEAEKELQVEEILDEQIEAVMKKMPVYQINSKGYVQEWIEDFQEYDPGHRHFSPLFPLYPGTQFQDEVYLKAAEKSLEHKIQHHHLQIGWSCAWLINLWAKLGKGEKAFYYLDVLLKNSVYNNMLDLHPPLGEGPGEREVFQIDGNFGSVSGMLTMLMQSSSGKIDLLPALPKQWNNGYIRGMLAHRNITVDMNWKDGRIDKAQLSSPFSQSVNVRDCSSGKEWKIYLKSGESTVIE